jgi:hypothetical protein
MSDDFDDPTDHDVDVESVHLETVYPSVVEWVDQWLLPRFARSPKTHKWDPQWLSTASRHCGARGNTSASRA